MEKMYEEIVAILDKYQNEGLFKGYTAGGDDNEYYIAFHR